MNYETIYNKIIEKSTQREIPKRGERHHITPKCLGGIDDKSNIALLTYKEHYIAHRLLTKFINNNLLEKAVFFMSKNGKKSSRVYENMRNIRQDEYEKNAPTNIRYYFSPCNFEYKMKTSNRGNKSFLVTFYNEAGDTFEKTLSPYQKFNLHLLKTLGIIPDENVQVKKIKGFYSSNAKNNPSMELVEWY